MNINPSEVLLFFQVIIVAAIPAYFGWKKLRKAQEPSLIETIQKVSRETIGDLRKEVKVTEMENDELKAENVKVGDQLRDLKRQGQENSRMIAALQKQLNKEMAERILIQEALKQERKLREALQVKVEILQEENLLLRAELDKRTGDTGELK